MRLFLLTLVACGVAAPALAAPETIVGFWRWPDQPCTRHGGAIRILPLGLESEDATCRFSSVKREGNSVIWQGSCDDAEGGSRQTVTATEAGGRLTIRFNPGGNVLEGLRRCEKPPRGH